MKRGFFLVVDHYILISFTNVHLTNHAGGSQGWFGALPLQATGGVSSLSILLVFTLSFFYLYSKNKYPILF